MLTVTDEFKGSPLVFTMLKYKCFREDFYAQGTCSQVAFTKDYR
ncbi:unnamed protein product, partial [Rotaria sp. Silwood1]